ncbi:MAG: hypothetical protein O2899_07940 [Bacteroidetes bacterium]|nr:hypothetical protein [Bacteroidota bacterium]
MKLKTLLVFLAGLVLAFPVQAQETAPEAAWEWNPEDPRIGLSAGIEDAGEAIWNLEKLSSVPRPAGFTLADEATGGRLANTDLAFRDNYAFVGNYGGINVYDVSDPANPTLEVSIVCPGGQGDVSVHGNLLFMSAQETRGRLDCGAEGVAEEVSPERFRGVRIFDISDMRRPRQVAAVQTCRGSHTHSLVSDIKNPERIFVYVSGTSPSRPGEELDGCSGADPGDDPNTSYFRIEVIEVPVDRPQDSRVVNEPRIFEVDGNIAGLWQGGDYGPGTQSSRRTDRCHDITAYPELGLAGGACSGNGILLDISDPSNPVRIEDVADPNFAYWHSATFNNDGTTVLFTDEWGGGNAPRCQGSDLPTWGANAMFKLRDGRLSLAGYYKLPAPQTEFENCVAHNGSLIPVPGRDIKAQAWYQGGLSVFDFTDPSNAYEIAYFDRGPISTDPESRITGGYWSTYWYNGFIYGSEIVRGMDVLALQPSEHLSQNELDAAKLVVVGELNPQNQMQYAFPMHPTVAKAYIDQLVRADQLEEGDRAVLFTMIDAGDGNSAATWARTLEEQAVANLAANKASHWDTIRARLAEQLRAVGG